MTSDKDDERHRPAWSVDKLEDNINAVSIRTICDVQAANDNYRLARDLVRGADGLADYLFGDRRLRRRIYYLATVTNFPVFRLGSMLYAKKSTVDAWIDKQVRLQPEFRGGELKKPANDPYPQNQGVTSGDHHRSGQLSANQESGAEADTSAEDPDDELYTASKIAEFLFGDPTMMRRIYHLASTSNVPITEKNGVLYASRSVLEAWIAKQETNPRGGQK